MDIPLVGNLTDDPVVVINEPNARVQFTLAVGESYKDTATGEWKDKPAMFWPCFVWNGRARKVAEAGLVKGSRVILLGTLRVNAWQDETGQNHRRNVIDVKALGLDMCMHQPTPTTTGNEHQETLDVGKDRTNAWDQPEALARPA